MSNDPRVPEIIIRNAQRQLVELIDCVEWHTTERARIAAILRTFHQQPLSPTSLQAVLDLATALNPDLVVKSFPVPTFGYPPDWPACLCGEPVLDGHVTCGRAECDEAAARDERRRELHRMEAR